MLASSCGIRDKWPFSGRFVGGVDKAQDDFVVTYVFLCAQIPVSHAIKLELQFILDFRQTCRPSYLSGDGVDSPERSSSEEAGNSAKSYELDEWLAEE